MKTIDSTSTVQIRTHSHEWKLYSCARSSRKLNYPRGWQILRVRKKATNRETVCLINLVNYL